MNMTSETEWNITLMFSLHILIQTHIQTILNAALYRLKLFSDMKELHNCITGLQNYLYFGLQNR